MKKVLKIAVLALVYLFLCGKSCQDDRDITGRQIKEVESLKDSIREEFGTKYLSEEAKYATELTAIQKVKDLADYVEIYADASLEPVFRKKAGDMIRNMFSSEDVRVTFYPYGKRRSNEQTLKKFFTKGFGPDVTSIGLSYDSVRIEMPLQKTGPERYEGSVTGIQKLTLLKKSDTLSSFEVVITVSIQAAQTAKIFGKDTVDTWVVHLGDMNPVASSLP